MQVNGSIKTSQQLLVLIELSQANIVQHLHDYTSIYTKFKALLNMPETQNNKDL